MKLFFFRDDLLQELEPKIPDSTKEIEITGRAGDGATNLREICTEMLEVGIFSLLKSLSEVVRGGEQSSAEAVEGHEGDEGEVIQQRSRTPPLAVFESVALDEHWMKEGEREIANDFIIANQNRKHATKREASTLARAEVLRLVQRFPALNLKVSDALGSQLICSFLSLWGDVDAALAVLNILLRSGGHASDTACELLARQLLATGRQPMALAICRLMHSRGRLCSTSFYSFLFTTLLLKGKDMTIHDNRDIEQDRLRDRDRDRDRGRDRDIEMAAAAAAAATEVHELLQDISAANLTPSPSRGGSGTPNSSLNSIKLREVAIDLAGIFIKLGYPDKNVKAVYSVIGQKEKESRL